MKISIFEKYRPFSVFFKTKAIIPKTSIEAVIFPTKILFKDKKRSDEKILLEIVLELDLPISKFVVFQDLEKDFLEVSFFSNDKYFRYQLFLKDEKIAFFLKRGEKINYLENNEKKVFLKKKITFLNILNFLIKKENSKEKLFLGITKKMDIFYIYKRGDLKEIFPILYSLSQVTPIVKKTEYGTCKLLKNLNNYQDFLNLFYSSFSYIFSPKLFDDNFLGFVKNENIKEESSSLYILNFLEKKIREMFFYIEENNIFILKNLFFEFHSGRFINIKTPFGIFSMEWSKKTLKKVILKASISSKILFFLQSKIKNFRIRESKKEFGRILKNKSSFEIEKNKIYFF